MYMLEGCFCQDCMLSVAMRNRSLDVSKIKDSKAKAEAMDIKRKYSLRQVKDNGLKNLFRALKGAAKNGD